jgi:hypothetical protein
MSAILRIGFRPSEMSTYDDNYRVWNGSWGYGNFGSEEIKVDSSSCAVTVPENGLYRITGVLVGQATQAGMMGAYINLPPADLKTQHSPAYPFPFYVGSEQDVTPGRYTISFSNVVEAGPDSPFSFYMSNNFQPNDPYARILIELIQQ